MRYFKAALRKVVESDDGVEQYRQSWTEIRPISTSYVDVMFAWKYAAVKASQIAKQENMPLEWIQEIDEYEWGTL